MHVACLCHRFPVPVCGKTQQPPWITSALRNEVLFAEVEEWSVNSHLHPLALVGDAPWRLDYQFALAQGTVCMALITCDTMLDLMYSLPEFGWFGARETTIPGYFKEG